MSTELATNEAPKLPALKPAIIQQITAIEAAAADGMLALNIDEGNIFKMFHLSAAVSKLREVLTDEIVQQIMLLEGSPLGYRTDKDSITITVLR